MVTRYDFADTRTLANQAKAYRRTVRNAQAIIFEYLLSIVKIWPAEDVLDEFKHLFIHHSDVASSSELLAAVYRIVASNEEKEFKNTLKRSCYILINNWDISRNHHSVKQLVQLFSDSIIQRPSTQASINRLRKWLRSFVNGEDFKELTLFAARYDDFETLHWTQRYTSYLLVSQYTDEENSAEQREAAQSLSAELRERFKVDLARYTAFSDETLEQNHDRVKDPTILGNDSLKLIKSVLARYEPFSYERLARLFRRQTLGMNYRRFKRHLCRYLVYPATDREATVLHNCIEENLSHIYQTYHDRDLDEALLLRTCNRLIDCLTTEDHENPSDTFLCVIAQGNALPIVMTLLKLLFICRNVRTHLEERIADLIRYYENYPQEECRWVIDFFELFNVALTVYAEDIRYNLVRPEGDSSRSQTSLNACRIFSQLKYPHLLERGNRQTDSTPHLLHEFIEDGKIEDGKS